MVGLIEMRTREMANHWGIEAAKMNGKNDSTIRACRLATLGGMASALADIKAEEGKYDLATYFKAKSDRFFKVSWENFGS